MKIIVVLVLGFLLSAGLVTLQREISSVNRECDRDHGIVVHGQQGEPGVSWSGYVCIEKGRH